MKISAAIVLLAIVPGLAGCGDSSPAPVPSAPSPLPQAGAPAAVIAGVVTDTVFRPLAGARIEIMDGSQAGASATSNFNGAFSFAGTFAGTETLRATKDGYVAAAQAVGSPLDRRIEFYLEVGGPTVNIAGDYTLNFVADSACTDLPSDLRARTYTATITPTSPPNAPPNTAFVVTVSGAPFLEQHNSFPIFVAGEDFRFWIGEPSLVEQIAPDSLLEINGWGGAPRGSVADTISSPFDGWFDYSGQAVAHARCTARNHQLILTRR
jgi:hypothetical protein